MTAVTRQPEARQPASQNVSGKVGGKTAKEKLLGWKINVKYVLI